MAHLTLEHHSTLIALSRLGKLHVLQSQYEEAESDLTQALQEMLETETETSTFESEYPDILADTILQLSLCSYYQSKNLPQMFRLLRETYDQIRPVLGKDHPVLLEIMHRLAVWHQVMGGLREGLQLCEDGWRICERKFVPGNELRIKFTSLLAVFRSMYAEYAQAESLASNALKMSRQEFGETHPLTIQCMWADAFVCGRQFSTEKIRAAEAGLRKTVELSRERLGKDHYTTFYYRFNLVNVLIKMGEFEKAESLLLDLLESRRDNLAQQHDWALTTMFSVMKLYALQGKGKALRNWCAEQILRQDGPNGQGDFAVAFTHSMLARLQATYPDPNIRNGPDAIDNAIKACKQYDEYWLFKKSLAAAHAEAGDFNSAVECQNDAIELVSNEAYVDELEAQLLRHDLKRYSSGRLSRESHFALDGCMLFLLGEHDKAEDTWINTWKYTEQLLGAQHPETQACIWQLIDLYEAQGKSEEAKNWREKLPGR